MRRDELLGLVDVENGLVDRAIYSDAGLYEIEMERVFARAWLFMCHDSQIPNYGDFFMSFMGEDRVIVVRDGDGKPQVLVNSCRHRGNAVCRAEEGHATSFMCTYHGWTYDLQGKLVGVPGFKEVYYGELDRENWGLITAGKVDSYKGFIFATLDGEAPDLEDYLGEVGRLNLDLMAVRGTLEAAGGVEKYTIPCNWKFAADNVWDFYHAGITHASAGMAGWNQRPATPRAMNLAARFSAPNLAVLGEYGHAIGGPAVSEQSVAARPAYDNDWREWPDAKEVLGEVGVRAGGNGHLFPNLWIQQNFWMLALRVPKGPTKTEIWWFTFTPTEMDPKIRRAIVERSSRHNGPAGMTEIDDGENWNESTRGTRGAISSTYPLHYAMNLGRGEVIQDELGPTRIETGYNEHAQLWHYRSWAEFMAAESWSDLQANRSAPESLL